MTLIDTHTHAHWEKYPIDPEAMLAHAQAAGVTQLICVGTTAADSARAVDFANTHKGCRASVGLHPNDGKLSKAEGEQLRDLVRADTVAAVGECGLDYYYQHVPAADQKASLRWQIELALEHNLPLIFHVRGADDPLAWGAAFTDFFKIVDEYSGVPGVVHSFSASTGVLHECLERGLYIGLNGIMTFTKDTNQLETAKAVPLKRLLLETDAPYLTPVPKRGKVNESANVRLVAEFLVRLRGETLEQLAAATSRNAKELFGL